MNERNIQPQYGARDASLYDTYATGVAEDVGFHVSMARETGEGPVIEMGCGTGRLLLPILDEGIDIIGVDREPEMLDIAKRKIALTSPKGKAVLVQDDIRTFRAEVPSPLIIVAYRTFLHLTEPDAMRQALNVIRKNLASDGRLVVSFFDPALEFIGEYRGPIEASPVRTVRTFYHPVSGRLITTTNRRSVDPEYQLVTTESIFEETGGETVVVPLTLRYVFRYEMQYLLELCGFYPEALYGDFNRGPYRYGGEQIWVAKPAGHRSKC